MLGHGANTDGGLDPQLVFQRVFDVHRDFLQLLAGGIDRDLLDHRNIRLIDAQDKVLHLVREHTGQNIHGSHVTAAHLTDEEHGSGGIGSKMELLGPDVDIPGKDIVHDDILDEGAPVVLLLIKDLRVIQRNVSHGAEGSGHLIVAGAEDGVFKEIGAADNGLEALLGKGHHALRSADPQRGIWPALSKQRNVRAGHNAALRVDDSECSVRNIL